jgi:hypothetical protein
VADVLSIFGEYLSQHKNKIIFYGSTRRRGDLLTGAFECK